MAIVFIIFRIFFATNAVLKTGEYQSDIPQFWLGNMRSRDASRSIAHERNYLMDYSDQYSSLAKHFSFIYLKVDLIRAVHFFVHLNFSHRSFSIIFFLIPDMDGMFH